MLKTRKSNVGILHVDLHVDSTGIFFFVHVPWYSLIIRYIR